jgi:pimeloyl-ACP methyl ester carboxylesterase
MRDRRARVKAWSQSLWEGHLNPILIAILQLLYITKPTHLILGEADAIVGPDQLTGLSDTSTQMIAESGHFDLIHPATAAFEQVLKALEYLMQTGSTSGG